MADPIIAIRKVRKVEGRYVKDPNDSGGETYSGVSRNNWPKWIGWKFIDNAKKQPNFSHNLESISQLQDMVYAFYKKNFWDAVGGDKMKNQDIANLLMDSAVNEGVVPAIKRAQHIVGLAQTGTVNQELITKLNLL